MSFNIDTKENFNVISSLFDAFDSQTFNDMTVFLEENDSLGTNLIFDISTTKEMDTAAMQLLSTFQEGYYGLGKSFVICCDNEDLYAEFQTLFPTDTINITPTQAEAIDIVSMEILERELMGEDDGDFSMN